MIVHIWTVLCSQTSVDKTSNNISLFNVLEELKVAGLTLNSEKTYVLPISFELVTFWARDDDNKPTKGQASVRLLAPNGMVMKEQVWDVDLSSFQRFRSIIKISGLPVKQAGRYQFQVQIKDEDDSTWRVCSKVPLQIIFKPSPEKTT